MVHKEIAEHRARMEKRTHSILKGAGYKVGGRVHNEASEKAEDKASDAKMIHKHERHLHKGEALTKYKSGGSVGGAKAKHKAGSRSRGNHVHINIIPGAAGRIGAGPMAPPPPMPMPPRPMPAPPMGVAGGPPGMGPMPPRPPMGGAPIPGMGMKRGGKVKGYEGSKADIAEDKRQAKKRGMTLKQWEASEEDEKLDKAHSKKKFARGGAAYPLHTGSGGGEGRIAKAVEYGAGGVKVREHLRKYPHRRGGKC